MSLAQLIYKPCDRTLHPLLHRNQTCKKQDTQPWLFQPYKRSAFNPAPKVSAAYPSLNGQSLDLLLQSLDLARQLRQLVGADAGGNHGTAHTAGAAQQGLAGDVDVRDALVFADERDVQDDGQGLGVGSKDGKLAGSTVDSLGDYSRKEKQSATIATANSGGISKHTFVGTLLSLTNVHGRLEEIQNLLGQGRIGQGPSCKEQFH